MAIVQTDLTCPNGHTAEHLFLLMDMPVAWKVERTEEGTILCENGYEDWYEEQSNARLFCPVCSPGEFPIPEGFTYDFL
jgi:hypothetical protein